MDEKAGLRALEQALAAFASAPAEDKGIRLDELRAVPVETERLAKLKEHCIASHERFMQAERFLDDAKAKTREVEALITAARAANAKGEQMTGEEEARIKSASDDASALLGKANGALAQAEALADQCRKERVALNRLLLGQGA